MPGGRKTGGTDEGGKVRAPGSGVRLLLVIRRPGACCGPWQQGRGIQGSAMAWRAIAARVSLFNVSEEADEAVEMIRVAHGKRVTLSRPDL